MYGYYPFVFPSLCTECSVLTLDTMKLRRKVISVLQYVFLLRGKVVNPGTLNNVDLFALNKYVHTGRQCQLFVFTTRSYVAKLPGV